MKNLLVTGVNGQLGHFVRQRLLDTRWADATDVVFATRQELDLSSLDSIERFFEKHGRFDTVLNLAAYTQVDRAEEEREPAWQVNAVAPAELGDACERIIHVSTDYVYAGDKNQPYVESDPTGPLSFYGESKLAGEQALEEHPHAIIVRTAWLYSERPGNFLTKITAFARQKPELRIVADQRGTPTYADDLAAALVRLLERDAPSGIYHYSNEGETNWYEFARFFLEKQGITTPVRPIATHEYPTLAKRPPYAVLDKSKIKRHLGISIPHWQESVETCLSRLEKSQARF